MGSFSTKRATGLQLRYTPSALEMLIWLKHLPNACPSQHKRSSCLISMACSERQQQEMALTARLYQESMIETPYLAAQILISYDQEACGQVLLILAVKLAFRSLLSILHYLLGHFYRLSASLKGLSQSLK